MVANHGQGHLTKADDDGFVLVEKKKKMASIQPTINKPTTNKNRNWYTKQRIPMKSYLMMKLRSKMKKKLK